MRVLSVSQAQKSKSEMFDFDRLSTASNGSDSSQKRQQNSSSRVKQQQMELEMRSKRSKKQMEQNQRQKGKTCHKCKRKGNIRNWKMNSTQFPIGLQSAGLNDTNDVNRFDFSFLTANAEDTQRCSLFLIASVGV